jgi:hypothetical protein
VWPPFLLLAMPGIDAATQRGCATRWLEARLARFQAEGAGARSQRARQSFPGRPGR